MTKLHKLIHEIRYSRLMSKNTISPNNIDFDLSVVNILGTDINAINIQIAVDKILEWIKEEQKEYVCVANVHSVMESYRKPEINNVFRNAGMVTPDGMPLVWMCRQLGYTQTNRVYGPDLLEECCRRTNNTGIRHYFYGGKEGIARILTSRLKRKYEQLNIVGTHTPPFRTGVHLESDEIIDEINNSKTDIIWVGLGAPKQELWMAKHRDRIAAPVMIGVGAAFDFISGTKAQAPRWMMKIGLEWLFRLISEPGRLWKRYFRYNAMFILLALLQLIGIRKSNHRRNN